MQRAAERCSGTLEAFGRAARQRKHAGTPEATEGVPKHRGGGGGGAPKGSAGHQELQPGGHREMQRDTKRCSGALGALRRAAGQRKLRRNTRGRRKVFKNMGGGAPRGFAGHQEVQRATETCSRTAKATPKHQRPPKGFQKHREGAPRGSAGHQTVQRATERRSGHREVFRCTGCTGRTAGQ
jgi:hypothetical protein